ncbi:MAG TPA: molybdenum ABC transporter ATP-binding protein [Rhizomicrobium sp.]|jgi:molybdate transport system ATP-binding protein|nr:molybdenum ABC transporter ATP-binding protein [Rhizomicrobium sp.]
MIDVCVRQLFKGFTLDAAFQVERPGITALFGPSGAGKTTLVNAIAGILRPRAGRIVIGDRVLLDTASGTFVPPRERRMGMVFQDARLFPHMSVENNLRFGWRRAAQKASEREFIHILDMLGLEPLLPRRPARLSGGEKSRVALGRALMASPQLLLLDEPLAALDAARKAEILPYLERLRDEAKLPMIYVTHSLEEVMRLADHLILLREGRVVAQGRAFDLLSDLEFATAMQAPSPGAVFAARVKGPRADGLTVLEFDGGELVVARLDRAPGSQLRVRLRAEDIMLALEEPRAISANNILPATVRAIDPRDADADVQLAVGNVKLVARITRASLDRLGIAPEMKLFAIVKSVTVDSGIANRT